MFSKAEIVVALFLVIYSIGFGYYFYKKDDNKHCMSTLNWLIETKYKTDVSDQAKLFWLKTYEDLDCDKKGLNKLFLK